VTEDNSFGTHEFLYLCEQLGCEPVICGNLGSGAVREMAEWVEYLTSDAISPMTELRKQNGREQPWKVKFWDIGNENWGCGGNMRPEFYADMMRRYSTYCRNYGNNRLYKIACGPHDNNYEWTEILMKDERTRRMMNGLSFHYYTVCHDWRDKGSATKFDDNEWFLTMSKTLNMDEYITKHSKIMDKYDPQKRIGLIVDEWGNWHNVESGTNPSFLYQQNTLRDAIAAAMNLNMFNNHCDRVKMANIAQTVNVLQSVLLTKNDLMVLTPTYYVFKMYKVHHEATLLPIDLQCEVYSFKDNPIPAVSVSASRDSLNRFHISLVNLNPEKAIEIKCELRGIEKVEFISGRIITADKMNAYNDFNRPEAVNIQPFKAVTLEERQLNVKLPQKSIVTLELK